jgi:hypothetical protein
MKLLVIVLCGMGRGCWGWGDGGDYQTNIQCKAIQNCHNKSPPYNEDMLTKMKNKKGLFA